MLHTLRWLLRLKQTTLARSVLRNALSTGLISGDLAAHWQVGDAAIQRLLSRPNLAPAASPHDIALILLGLGECAARSHNEAEELIHGRLTKAVRGREAAVLTAAFEETITQAKSVSLADHGAAQLLAHPGFSWDMLQQADALADQPMDTQTTPRYGLEAVIQLVLAMKPQAIRALMSHAPGHPVLSAIVRATVKYVQSRDLSPAASVAATGVPLLVCIAAARLASATGGVSEVTHFASGWQCLVGAGVDGADATWLMALHLKEAVHQRFRYRHAIEEETKNLRWFRANEATLSPFERHRLERVAQELPEREKKAALHETILDRILDDMARLWPASGLTSEQYRQLSPCFVDSSEIRHRLAMKLTTPSERAALLKQTIDAWKREVGVGLNAEKAFAEEYHPQIDTLIEQTLWAARSFISLHESTQGGVGRPTSLLIAKLKTDAEVILAQPFMAARQGARWQAALLRSTASALFALIVVVEVPVQQRASVSILCSYALDHARHLLHQAEWIGASWELLDRLASIGIGVMAEDPIGGSQLATWAEDDQLPVLTRATAAWSNPDYLVANLDRACRLFAMAADPPLPRASRDRQFNQVMSLLDVAAATAGQSSNSDLGNRLCELWKGVVSAWGDYADVWSSAADWLIKAVQGEGEERTRFMAHPSFANSRCKAVITLRNPQSIAICENASDIQQP